MTPIPPEQPQDGDPDRCDRITEAGDVRSCSDHEWPPCALLRWPFINLSKDAS